MARTSIEERKNIRRAVGYVILSVIILIFFLYVGFPLVARFATFLTDFRKSGEAAVANDTTPPAPPRLSPEEEVTSKNRVKVTGTTESGATVILTANGKEEEFLADADGEFTYDFALKAGENSISAKAIDTSGNIGQESETLIIVQDDEDPTLTILNPSDGTTFYGAQQRQVTIQGETEVGASVTINERVVVVDSAGKFSFFTSLSDGENKFNVKAVDAAGNSAETSLTLHYSP